MQPGVLDGLELGKVGKVNRRSHVPKVPLEVTREFADYRLVTRRLVVTALALALVAAGMAAAVLPGAPAYAETGVTALGAGGLTSCAVDDDGALQCWGDNRWGQLGDGTTGSRSAPVDVVGLDDGVTAVDGGGSATCALKADGSVYCWGRNQYGMLGNGTTDDAYTPVQVDGLAGNAVQISVGAYHACARLDDGSAQCWGNNWYGSLGDGTENDSTTPVAVVDLDEITDISAGSIETCAVSNGAVFCWGSNQFGKLGRGSTSPYGSSEPAVAIASGAVSVSTGTDHVCAVLVDASVQCWGRNEFGQLGDGTTTDRNSPVGVLGLDDATWVGADWSFSCARSTLGAMWCWGRNRDGGLGNGLSEDAHEPTSVLGLGDGVLLVALGSGHACASTVAAGVVCWGHNILGELGVGTQGWTDTFRPVAGLAADTVAIGGGANQFCAISDEGALRCWGLNYDGQLGDGTTVKRPHPTRVSGLDQGVVAVDGYLSTCALKDDGSVWCWGNNQSGQLGDGTTVERHTPVVVAGLHAGAAAIAVGGGFACALLTDQHIKCWGNNMHGQLGDGTTTNRLAPVTVSGNDTFTALSVGHDHACAITTEGAAKCWGSGSYGKLGSGNDDYRALTPTAVVGLETDVLQLSTGTENTCAVLQGGSVSCWGINDSFQLGTDDPEVESSNVPIAVPGLASGIRSVDASSAGTNCAITTTDALKCWGLNLSAQSGYAPPTVVNSPTPELVDGLASDVERVVSPSLYTCALAAGVVHCVGSNSYAQLGDGGYETRVPLAVIGYGRGNMVAPPAPTSFVTERSEPSTAELTWAPPADDGGAEIHGYLVTVLDEVGDPATGITQQVVAGTSLEIDGLETATSYRFEVSALSFAGLGWPVGSDVVPPTPSTTTSTTTTTAPTTTTSIAPTTTTTIANPKPPAKPRGYWLAQRSGRVHAFGAVKHYGNWSTTGVTHLERTPSGKGYWVVNASGAVAAFGDARKLAGAGALIWGERVEALASTKTGKGYWLFTNRGRVIARGDARSYGDASKLKLKAAIIASVATPTGKGYYMVASDGGVFTFGDARFRGSMGATRLNAPVIGLVPTPAGTGYWLVASDGGIFTFNATFRGSLGGRRISKPVVAMVAYGNGYVMTTSGGKVYEFSNLPYAGSIAAPAAPVVSIAASS